MSSFIQTADGLENIASRDRKHALGDVLRYRITTTELKPGAVLDEVILAEEFGLSRPPVREMMRQLAAEGYIELEANRSARVSGLSYQSLRNFYLAAPALYVTTTWLAAENASALEVEELRAIQVRFRAAIESNNVVECIYANDQFHYAIGRMAHNPYLLPSLRRLQLDHARLGRTFYQPVNDRMVQELALAAQQHDDIIAAIAIRDSKAAGDLVREHLELGRRNMAMYVTPEGMEVPEGM